MGENDAWDDTALLKAYDDAVKGIKPSKQKKTRSVSYQPKKQFKNDTEPPLTVPKAPKLGKFVDPELEILLQAYFEAGYALGRYAQKNDLAEQLDISGDLYEAEINEVEE